MVRRHSIARPASEARCPCSAGTSLDDGVGIGADHVMMDHALELIEPPRADLGQHRALHRDGLGHDHVEGADAVGGQRAARGRRRRRRYRGPCRARSVAGAGRWRAWWSWANFQRRRRFAEARATRWRDEDSSLRQRNELGLVGDVREAAALPVLLWPARSAPCWKRRNSTRYGAGLPARRRRETSFASALSSLP